MILMIILMLYENIVNTDENGNYIPADPNKRYK